MTAVYTQWPLSGSLDVDKYEIIYFYFSQVAMKSTCLMIIVYSVNIKFEPSVTSFLYFYAGPSPLQFHTGVYIDLFVCMLLIIYDWSFFLLNYQAIW